MTGQLQPWIGAWRQDIVAAVQSASSDEDWPVLADLVWTTAPMLLNAAAWADAQTCLKQGIEAARRLDDSLAEALFQHNLGVVAHETAKFAEADEHYESAEKLLVAQAQQSAMARLLFQRARLAVDRARYQEATDLLRKVRETWTRLNEPAAAIALTTPLYRFALTDGVPSPTDIHWDEVNQDLLSALGPDHPSIARFHAQKGIMLHAGWNWPEALAEMQDALDIDRRSFGADHPAVAADLCMIGALARDVALPEDARDNLEQALRIDERVFGDEHPAVARDLGTLAGVLLDLGDLDAARTAAERALSTNKGVFGSGHPYVARDHAYLAEVLRESGDYAAAFGHVHQAEEIDNKSLPAEHPSVVRRLNIQATLLADTGSLEAARNTLRQALVLKSAKVPYIRAVLVNNLLAVDGANNSDVDALAVLADATPPNAYDLTAMARYFLALSTNPNRSPGSPATMSDEHWAQIGDLLGALRSPMARATTVTHLASVLLPDREAALLRHARSIPNVEARTRALAGIAEHLNGSAKAGALREARSLSFELDRGATERIEAAIKGAESSNTPRKSRGMLRMLGDVYQFGVVPVVPVGAGPGGRTRVEEEPFLLWQNPFGVVDTDEWLVDLRRHVRAVAPLGDKGECLERLQQLAYGGSDPDWIAEQRTWFQEHARGLAAAITGILTLPDLRRHLIQRPDVLRAQKSLHERIIEELKTRPQESSAAVDRITRRIESETAAADYILTVLGG